MGKKELLTYNQYIDKKREIGAGDPVFPYDKILADNIDNVFQMLLECNEFMRVKFISRRFNRRHALSNRYWLPGPTQYCSRPVDKVFYAPLWKGRIDKFHLIFLEFNLCHNKFHNKLDTVSFCIKTYSVNEKYCDNSLEFLRNEIVPLFTKGGKFNHLVKELIPNDEGFYVFELYGGVIEEIAEEFIRETWHFLNDLISNFKIEKTEDSYYGGLGIISDKEYLDGVNNIQDNYY